MFNVNTAMCKPQRNNSNFKYPRRQSGDSSGPAYTRALDNLRAGELKLGLVADLLSPPRKSLNGAVFVGLI